MTMFRTMQLSLCAAAVGVAAMSSAGAAQSKDPGIGSWTLNIAKSTYSPGPAPKMGSVTFTAAGQGIKVVVDTVPASGDKVHWEYTANYDGKDNPITGNNPDADTVSVKWVDAKTVQSSNKKAGKPTLTNTRVGSADGKTLTVTSKGTNTKGQAVMNVQVFEKQM